MRDRYSAEHARKLVHFCRNLDDARFLIDHSSLLGPLQRMLECQNGNTASLDILRRELEDKTKIPISPEELQELMTWLHAVGAVRNC
ncbi:MAG: hypothetical protein U1D30_23135 [Planctomycetota bacterium]